MRTHFQVERLGHVRIARCGQRFDAADSRPKLMTTATAPVTCQRCRNFIASDRAQPKPKRGSR